MPFPRTRGEQSTLWSVGRETWFLFTSALASEQTAEAGTRSCLMARAGFGLLCWVSAVAGARVHQAPSREAQVSRAGSQVPGSAPKRQPNLASCCPPHHAHRSCGDEPVTPSLLRDPSQRGSPSHRAPPTGCPLPLTAAHTHVPQPLPLGRYRHPCRWVGYTRKCPGSRLTLGADATVILKHRQCTSFPRILLLGQNFPECSSTHPSCDMRFGVGRRVGTRILSEETPGSPLGLSLCVNTHSGTGHAHVPPTVSSHPGRGECPGVCGFVFLFGDTG